IEGYLDTHFDRLQDAVGDFTQALEIDPNVATAYMNRGFVLNDLEEPTKAAKDFQMALKLRPNYGEAHLGLAYADLQLRRSRAALKEAELAARLLGESRTTHLARAEAYRQQIMLRQAGGEYRAALKITPLDAPNSDRVGTRLALARLFSESGHPDQAQQQVSLGFAESRVGEANPITAEHLIEAAQVLMSIQEFDLAKKYFERAQAEGADEQAVAIGMTNAYLALGETQSAGQTIKSLGNNPDNYENYDYLIALGNVYRQEHETAH